MVFHVAPMFDLCMSRQRLVDPRCFPHSLQVNILPYMVIGRVVKSLPRFLSSLRHSN